MLKKMNKKGFTLAELLIVVAIIAVLVAISIPIFSAQLEKAREATDAANIRAVYVAVSTDVLQDPQANDTANNITYSSADKTYTATVTAVQTEPDWQTASLKEGKIGGQTVAAQTKESKGWTIKGDVASGKVTIEASK